MGKASLYMERHFLEPPSIEPIVSVDQVYDSIDYELRDKIYEEIDSVNEGKEGGEGEEGEEEDNENLRDLYFKKITLPKKKMFATLWYAKWLIDICGGMIMLFPLLTDNYP